MTDEYVDTDVLIVEDDKATTALEQRELARNGRKKSVISSGVRDVLKFLKKGRFAAIILDYQPHGGEACDVVEAAALMTPQIPVLLATDQESEAVAAEAIRQGVADYLMKSGAFLKELPVILDRVAKLARGRERLRATKEQNEFLASMSHEIRTPLSAVIGFGYLLEKTPLSDDQRRLIKNIQFAGATLLGVVNDVLDLSKIDAGEMHLASEAFDAPALLSNVLQMLKPQAETKGIELIALPPSTLLCAVKGDESRVRRILINLVNNAIKFTQAGHVAVKISYSQRGSQPFTMRFEVTDTGIGIEAEALKRLFQPFAQADATITQRFGGTGLGLSISRRLVHLMGGDIGVVSTVEVGSTFWFEIPLESSPVTVAPSRQVPMANPAWQSRLLNGVRAMVADDSASNLAVIRRILQSHGAVVTCCADGADAVEHLSDHNQEFDVVLMDVQMSHVDGNEASRRIRGLGLTDLPIIALTGSALRSDQWKSLDAGMNDFILKPFDPQTVVRKVQRLVAVYTQTRAARADAPPRAASRH